MKRFFVIFVSAILIITFIAGCSKKEQTSTSGTAKPGTTTSAGASGDGATGDGLPLVSEPLTFKVACGYNQWCPWEECLALQKVQEVTGITFDYRIYSDAEQISLMYASRDYPDISIGLFDVDQAKIDAMLAGDVVRLNDYMQYAPNVEAFLNEYPEIRAQITFPDGSIYAFPYAFLDEVSYGLRDVWLINRTWLDELNLEIPKTSDEFLNVLRAFRDNAGKGTIPQEVIPYYLRFNGASAIGSIYDVICAFGVYVYDGSFGIVDNGTFIFQAINPDIKEPIKYLAQMYSEKLIPVSMFTDDSATYYSVINSIPPIAGCSAGYHNGNNYTLGGSYYPMAPFQTPSGKKPYTRTQARGAQRNFAYMIYKNCVDVVAAVKLANYMASPEVSMEMQWGIEGYAWKYNDKGQPELNPEWVRDLEESGPYNGPDNLGFALFSSDFYINPSIELEGHRAWALYNVYYDYLPKPTLTYPILPAFTLDDMELARLNDLNEDILTYVRTTIANWIAGKGNIDAEWDAYIKKIEDLGLDEYLTLQQKKLDSVYKR